MTEKRCCSKTYPLKQKDVNTYVDVFLCLTSDSLAGPGDLAGGIICPLTFPLFSETIWNIEKWTTVCNRKLVSDKGLIFNPYRPNISRCCGGLDPSVRVRAHLGHLGFGDWGDSLVNVCLLGVSSWGHEILRFLGPFWALLCCQYLKEGSSRALSKLTMRIQEERSWPRAPDESFLFDCRDCELTEIMREHSIQTEESKAYCTSDVQQIPIGINSYLVEDEGILGEIQPDKTQMELSGLHEKAILSKPQTTPHHPLNSTLNDRYTTSPSQFYTERPILNTLISACWQQLVAGSNGLTFLAPSITALPNRLGTSRGSSFTSPPAISTLAPSSLAAILVEKLIASNRQGLISKCVRTHVHNSMVVQVPGRATTDGPISESGFIRKVYGILVVQLLVTFAIISIFIYTVLEGFMLGVVSGTYKTEYVLMACGITAWDFTMLGGLLFVFLIVLFCFGLLCLIIQNHYANIVYSSLGALLFSFYLVFDTQMMMGGKHKYSISPEEYIFAALNLYLDIINLFLFILSLVGNRN
ncbi:LFG1-like protein [Mya arenaria]|uniref:LFG1-like protein n=1 Tax=Mya arenaria TaxID=6604 RepID=A0ABY7EB10_MYAAR|nr:LFG1-like protein [Mya arenaria]